MESIVPLLSKVQSDPLTAALLVISAFVCIKAVQIIYTGMFGPLRHIPGPFATRVSHWPLRLAILQGRRMYFVDDLHRQYGHCVRIAPDEASISDIPSVKAIHKIGGGFLKAPFYSKFTQEKEEEKGVFAMRDSELHSERRKLLANGFSKNSLIGNWEATIEAKVGMAVKGIQRDIGKDGKANILAWLTFMANDIIATLSFGDSFHCLETGEKTPYIRDLETVLMISGISVELTWIAPFLRLFSPRSRLTIKGQEAYRANLSREADGKGSSNGTIFSKMFNAGDKGGAGAPSLSFEQITGEAGNLLVAGSDTTGNTLTYLIYSVLTNEEIKKKLLAEVEALEHGFTSQDALGLPYLALVIQETLRLYGAAPGGLPRSVPKGGRMLSGHFFPEDTVVTTQAYTLHRDALIFPDPLTFDPDRWISPTQSMKDAFMPWGGGTRVCLGLHLAMMELSVGAATFFREIPTAKISPQTTAKEMEMENYFLIAPRGHACYVTS